MHHIEIETVWRFHKEGSPQTAVVMLGILNEIRKTGKLTSAAAHAHLSYRHVWNLVEQWGDFFGVPVLSGTYSGGSLTIPMTGLTVAQPTGVVPNAATSTGPQFGAFVLITK